MRLKVSDPIGCTNERSKPAMILGVEAQAESKTVAIYWWYIVRFATRNACPQHGIPMFVYAHDCESMSLVFY